jgi:hypothetical protein
MTKRISFYKKTTPLTAEQWQKARRMWNDGKDTHDIACALVCSEANIYNGLYLLKLSNGTKVP